MKPYKYILFALLLLPFVTSCTKEENVEGPVSLNPNVAGVSITRAAINSVHDLNGKNIGFYVVNAKGFTNDTDPTKEISYGIRPTGTYGKYVGTTTGSGDGQTTTFAPEGEPQTIWLNNEKAIVFCCYPAPDSKDNIKNDPENAGTNADPVPTIAVLTDAIKLTNTANTSDKYTFDYTQSEYDYMYGVDANNVSTPTAQPYANNGHSTPSGDAGPGNNVSITLKHAFAQLCLKVKKSADYKGEAKVTSVKYTSRIPMLKAANETRMKLTDGTFINLDNADAATAAEKSYVYNISANAPASDINILTFTNYAVPCTSIAATISLTVDGKNMSVPCTSDWSAGNIYTYTVQINPTGLELTGINVVGWQDATDIPNTTI
ncbi:fimbrillin family protein [Parabacteroides sp.]